MEKPSLLTRVKAYFSTRYTSVPSIYEPEFQDERKRALELGQEEVKVIYETEKELDAAIAKFREGLEAFEVRRKFILSEKDKLLTALKQLDEEKGITSNLSSSVDSGKLSTNSVDESNLSKSQEDLKREEKEAKVRVILYHNLYTEIPNMIRTIENNIYNYIEEIHSLEKKKATMTSSRRELQRELIDSKRIVIDSENYDGESPSSLEDGRAIQLEEFCEFDKTDEMALSPSPRQSHDDEEIVDLQKDDKTSEIKKNESYDSSQFSNSPINISTK